MCDLQRNLSGVLVQHVHYDKVSKTVTGSEFVLPERKHKKVDGYYVDVHGEKIVIEFLGVEFHGHPSLWGEDGHARNHFGIRHCDNFRKTEQMLQAVSNLGYVVRYVWENEYRKLGALQSPMSILRHFVGKLEY